MPRPVVNPGAQRGCSACGTHYTDGEGHPYEKCAAQMADRLRRWASARDMEAHNLEVFAERTPDKRVAGSAYLTSRGLHAEAVTLRALADAIMAPLKEAA